MKLEHIALWTRMTFVRTVLTACMALLAITGAEAREPLHVAVSVYSTASVFMREWVGELERHPAVLDGRVKLDVYDCAGSQETQHIHFETISVQQPDAVIVVANDMTASKRVVELLEEAGMPVVASCAPTVADVVAFIGPDDVEAGYRTARSVVDRMGGKGTVLVLRGPPEQGAAQQRSVGIARALGEYPGIRELGVVSAGWSRAAAMLLVRDALDRNVRIDGIIAQNDELALEAIEVFQRQGLSLPVVASIDGIPAAVAAVEKGELLQTLRQDSALEAQGALDLVLRRLIGPDYVPESSAWTAGLLEQWRKGATRFIVPWQSITRNTR